MLRAARRAGRRVIPLATTRGTPISIPAPVGGWNTRDSVAAMPAEDAVVLDNWWPGTSDVQMRAGRTSFATGLGSAVESLMVWSAAGSSKMFAAAGGSVYETSGSGAVGAAEFSGMTSNRWQSVNFGNSAGNFLYLVNGADAPRYYDGSSWTVPTITGSGLTATDLINVTVFKNMLLFCENNALGFWYFPVETVAGAISWFDLSPRCKEGGELTAIGVWSRDGGSGMDDVVVFITSRGEAIIYQGTDPSDSTAWSHIGTFKLGSPIGRRCLLDFGPDLVIITVDGFTPISSLFSGGRGRKTSVVGDKIRSQVASVIASYKTNFGWEATFYAANNMVLFNVPIINNTEMQQYVVNTITGAWARFKNWNGNCFAVFNDELYYGDDGVVRKAWTGLDDDGADIEADGQTAFNYLGQKGRVKQFSMARVLLATDGTAYAALEAQLDFETRALIATPTFSAGTGSEWDVAEWDAAPWSDTEVINKDWHTLGGTGSAISLRVKMVSNGGQIRWLANDIIWQPGGFV